MFKKVGENKAMFPFFY